MTRAQKWLRALLFLIGAGAGTLAAVATSQVAVEVGATASPALSLIYPLIVEGGAILAVVLAMQRTSAGLSAWAEYAAFLVLLTLAAAVNLTHAGYGPDWLSAVVPPVLAACPPVILAGCVEMFLRSLRAHRSAERSVDLGAALTGDTLERVSVVPRALASGARERSAQEDVLVQSGAPKRSIQGDTSLASGASERSASAPLSARPVDAERPVSAPVGGAQPSTVRPASAERRDTSAGVSTPVERASTKRSAGTERPKVAAASGQHPSSTRKTVKPSDTKADTAERVATLLAERPDIKAPEVAALLGVGASTARRYLADLRAAG